MVVHSQHKHKSASDHHHNDKETSKNQGEESHLLGQYSTFQNEVGDNPGEEESEGEEEEAKVSTLELFSDLVIVVAIHYVAEPLEKVEEGGAWSMSLTLFLYVVQVTMLWMVWHNAMIFMNGAALFRSSSCPLHHVMTALVMLGVLSMTKQFGQHHTIPTQAVVTYLLVRLLEVWAYSASSFEEPKPSWVPTERVGSMRAFVPVMVTCFVACEVVPLAVAASTFRHHDHLDGEGSPTVFWVSLALYFGMNTVAWLLGSILSDAKSGGKVVKNLFVSEHLHERYELVTLICIGELCFAASNNVPMQGQNAALWEFIMTASPFALAFASYLIMFATRHGDCSCHTEFWHKSAKYMVGGMICFLGLFCAIPAMGSGFGRIFEAMEEEEEEESGEEERSLHTSSSSCAVQSSYFLCWSTATFLAMSTLISLLDYEPGKEGTSSSKERRMKVFWRLFLRLSGAVMILGFFVLWPELSSNKDRFCVAIGDEGASLPVVTILCPLLVLASVMVEIYGAGTMSWVDVTGFSFQFHWSDL